MFRKFAEYMDEQRKAVRVQTESLIGISEALDRIEAHLSAATSRAQETTQRRKVGR